MAASNVDVIDRINRCIEKYGCTSNALAKMAGISPSNLSKMLKGQQSITNRSLTRIANALNVDKTWLISGMSEPEGETIGLTKSAVLANKSNINIGLGNSINVALPENGTQKIINPDGTVEITSTRVIDNEYIALLKKKDEQIDRLISLLEKR
ncbi:MAG: helix-turn-helix domain-containing protein [Alistipes indistinctus]